MELHEKYLLIHLRNDVAKANFPEAESDTSGEEWTAFGMVRGETPQLGLWFQVEALIQPDGETIEKNPPQTYLIRWEWIAGSRYIGLKPNELPGQYL